MKKKKKRGLLLLAITELNVDYFLTSLPPFGIEGKSLTSFLLGCFYYLFFYKKKKREKDSLMFPSGADWHCVSFRERLYL